MSSVLHAPSQNLLTKVMDTAEEDEITASRRVYSEISLQLNQLVERFDRLHTSPSVATPPPDQDGTINRHAEPRLNPPAPYSGEPNTFCSFLSQCSLTFSLQPSCFPTERSKVAFIITLLVGQARDWGTAMWDNEQDCCSSFDSFSEELHKGFDRSARELRRHGPWHCYDRGRAQFPAIQLSFARSRHHVAGTTRLCGITFFTVWPNTSRMRSIPWNSPRVWTDSSISPSEWTTGFLSILVIGGAGFPLSSSLEPRQERRATRPPNISGFPRRSRCKSGEHG